MITLTPKQCTALHLIHTHQTTLLYGGSRSGKTFLLALYMHFRALIYPGIWQVAVRKYNRHAKESLFYKTFHDIIKPASQPLKKQEMDSISKQTIKHPQPILDPLVVEVTFIKSEGIIQYANGSRIIIGGLDEEDRTEKILGNEYGTIFLNEASQISYHSYEILLTRLNPPTGVSGKVLIDYNPPSIHHWGYSIFEKRLFPDHTQGHPHLVPEDDFACLQMNPADNKENISPEYLHTLNNLSSLQKQRFFMGSYTKSQGALWQQNWIQHAPPPSYSEIIHMVIGVDPAGSSDGDTVGIVACAVTSYGYYVLQDASMEHVSVYTWAKMVCDLYHTYAEQHGSVRVVAEKNYGGDMVEATLRSVYPALPLTLVVATKGKAIRAQPIASLYEQGKVWHCSMNKTSHDLWDLEQELITWTPKTLQSPGRMDALVWALSSLQDQFGNLILG